MVQRRLAEEDETLDPEDWQAMRQLGHQMVEDMITYLQTVRERAVWQPIPAGVRAQFELPVPVHPEGAERAYEDFMKYVLPHPMGNIHPRFWGWVMPYGPSPLTATSRSTFTPWRRRLHGIGMRAITLFVSWGMPGPSILARLTISTHWPISVNEKIFGCMSTARLAHSPRCLPRCAPY